MGSRSWSRAFILAAVVPLAGASAAAVAPSAQASPGPAGVAVRGADLSAVSAVSASDAWAVGYKCSDADCSQPDLTYSTLIQHWNGTAWSVVPSPNPGPAGRSAGQAGLRPDRFGPATDQPGTGDQLTGVSAVSASDAWAVGNGDAAGPLILHWNGTAWSQVTAPNLDGAVLESVSAASARDVWATGVYTGAVGVSRILMLHWNGTKWAQVASPSPAGAVSFSVSAASPADAWAVGRYFRTSPSGFGSLTLRWNGTKWAQVASPSPGAAGNELYGVSTVSPTDAWAVGESLATDPGSYRTLILRWNGQAWTRVPSPDPGSSYTTLSGVSAISPDDAWAVGMYSSNQGLTDSTLALRWNGKTWAQVPTPSPDPHNSGVNDVAGVSAVSATSAFAAGYADNAWTGVNLSLILNWNGSKWSQP